MTLDKRVYAGATVKLVIAGIAIHRVIAGIVSCDIRIHLDMKYRAVFEATSHYDYQLRSLRSIMP